MKAKLQEALDIVNDICRDVTGEFPASLFRVRRLIRNVLEGAFLDESDVAILAQHDDGERMYLGASSEETEPPKPAA